MMKITAEELKRNEELGRHELLDRTLILLTLLGDFIRDAPVCRANKEWSNFALQAETALSNLFQAVDSKT